MVSVGSCSAVSHRSIFAFWIAASLASSGFASCSDLALHSGLRLTAIVFRSLCSGHASNIVQVFLPEGVDVALVVLANMTIVSKFSCMDSSSSVAGTSIAEMRGKEACVDGVGVDIRSGEYFFRFIGCRNMDLMLFLVCNFFTRELRDEEGKEEDPPVISWWKMDKEN